jgi:hypothetical protein
VNDEPTKRITFASFQADAKPVKAYPPNPLYAALALGGEAGELLNVRKKIERDEPDRKPRQLGPLPRLDLDLLSEAGDILFYLRLALLERGFTLEDAAAACLEKLQQKRRDQLTKGTKVKIVGSANQAILGGDSFGKTGVVEDPPNSEDIVHIEVEGHKSVRFYTHELQPVND